MGALGAGKSKAKPQKSAMPARQPATSETAARGPRHLPMNDAATILDDLSPADAFALQRAVGNQAIADVLADAPGSAEPLVQRQADEDLVQRDDTDEEAVSQEQQQQLMEETQTPEVKETDLLPTIVQANQQLIDTASEMALLRESASAIERIEEMDEVTANLELVLESAYQAQYTTERVLEVMEEDDPDRKEIERIAMENEQIILDIEEERASLQEHIPEVGAGLEEEAEPPKDKLAKAKGFFKVIQPKADTNPWRLRAEAVGHTIAGALVFAVGGSAVATAVGAPVGLVLGILGGGQFAIAVSKFARSFINAKKNPEVIGAMISVEAAIWAAGAAIMTIATGGAWPAIVSAVGAGMKYFRGIATMFGAAKTHPKLIGLIQGIEAIIGIVTSIGSLVALAAEKGASWIAGQAAGVFTSLVKVSRGAGTAAGKEKK